MSHLRKQTTSRQHFPTRAGYHVVIIVALTSKSNLASDLVRDLDLVYRLHHATVADVATELQKLPSALAAKQNLTQFPLAKEPPLCRVQPFCDVDIFQGHKFHYLNNFRAVLLRQ